MKFFVLFLLALALANAAGTDTLSVDYCTEGVNLREDVCSKLAGSKVASLPLDEQKSIVLAMLTQGEMTIYDKLSFADMWNSKLELDEKPEDLEFLEPKQCTEDSKDCIYDAWFSIANIERSFYHNETLYVPEDSQIRLIYDFEVDVPSDRGYPNQRVCGSGSLVSFRGSSHCGFKFSQAGTEVERKLYVDSSLQDEAKDVLEYSGVNGEADLKAEVKFIDKVKVDYYDWVKGGCCKTKTKCGIFGCYTYCVKWWHTCVHSGSYIYNEELPVEQSYDIKEHDDYDVQYTLSYTDKFTEPKVEFATTIPECRLNLGKASLLLSEYKYNVTYKHPPYNFLQVNRIDDQTILKQGIDIVDGTVFRTSPTNLGSCVIEVFNPYNYEIVNCSTTEADVFTPKITLDTNMPVYNLEEDINLSFNVTVNEEDAEGDVIVNYADKSYVVSLEHGKGSIMLSPSLGDKKINVTYGSFVEEKNIHVYDSGRYWSITHLAISVGIIFLFAKAYQHQMLKGEL